MYERDQSHWLLKALRETTHELESQVWRLAHEPPASRPPGNAEQSATELAAHLGDCEERFLQRLRAVAAQDGADIGAFDPEGLESSAPDCGFLALLERFEALRRQTMDLLWMLAPADWRRSGRHPYLGRVSLTDLVREMHEHDLAHLWEVRRALESHG